MTASEGLEYVDPQLIGRGHFAVKIYEQFAAELGPAIADSRSFSPDTLPEHWRTAVMQTKESYARGAGRTLFQLGELPPTISTEILWAIDWQIRAGRSIDADSIRTLCINLEMVLISPSGPDLTSLIDLTRAEWMRAIRRERMRLQQPLSDTTQTRIGPALGRLIDVLAYAYHRGQWWELDLWNLRLDRRIPQRTHEPFGSWVIKFRELKTPWLRAGIKWWLSRQLELGSYTWTTAANHAHTIQWFQRYLDTTDCAGPLLAEDPPQLTEWVRAFAGWLRLQKCLAGKNKGKPLGPHTLRPVMISVEQFYAFMFEHRDEAASTLSEPRWQRIGPQHSTLFRFNRKPRTGHMPDPERVLSDAVISQIIQHSDLIAKPRSEGGLGQEQIVRILGLLIRTGRRISEIALLDFDPIVSIPFPDPNGYVARLRYQQTKIITSDNTILIDQEVVDLVRRQQEYARDFMAGAGKPTVDPKYLFLAREGNRNGDRPFSYVTITAVLAAYSKMIDLRDSQGKPLSISRTHSFRHTRATNLLNAGTPIHVAMRYMGHKTPTMFMHYAQTLSTVAEHEFLRYQKLTSDGRPFQGDPAAIYESIALDKRTDRILPNGYCTLPPQPACDKGNACLSCTKFVTDATFNESLQQQLAETSKLIDRRQATHHQRFGEPMTHDNIWFQGRTQEVEALNAILISLSGIRNADGTFTPVRGAGAQQHRTETH
jgi:integrase